MTYLKCLLFAQNWNPQIYLILIIEKQIRGGEINKNGWYKINKLFNQKRKTEFYQKDYQFKEIIDKSATIFVNGTAGKYEDIKYANGTRELLTNIVNSKAIKIVGGGDGVSAVKHFNLADRFNFLSTGGGATLEYIIQQGLPAIDNINDA